jgi:uncharacterized membrane protein
MFATLAIQNFPEMALCSPMRTDEFLGKLDHDRIVRAIREAEEKTSGEIRVFLQRGHLKGDALPAAQKQFRNLGMQKTKERNGVLIFVAPRARKFAVIGDQAIHEKCGEEFWVRVVEAIQHCFRNEKFTDGIGSAVAVIGEVLKRYFPSERHNRNELPDEIIES